MVNRASFRGDLEDDEDDDEDDEDDEEDSENVGLYERFGVQDKSRQRKRDRIKSWMTPSKRSTLSMVQPIRMEDGEVMETPRTKARFEKLFAGMPGLDEILGSSGSEDVQASSESSSQGAGLPDNTSESKKYDDSWFDDERRTIEQEFERILDETKAQLDAMRSDDPENVPENADGVVEAVVKQEMQKTIASAKTARAKERLEEYEIRSKSDLDSRDLSGADDALVRKLLEEAAEDWERQEALQAQVEDYMEYEKATFDTAEQAINDPSLPGTGSDLDKWALERLQEMLSSARQNMNADADGMISDILESNIVELRSKIDEASKRSSIEPQSMKEWQMYRAIATRLGQQKASLGEGDTTSIDEDEDEISSQLESWKQYLGKEEMIREKSGLSMGPKMPFEWQQAGQDASNDTDNEGAKSVGNQSRRDIRREVNLKAIAAMEDLLQKSDSIRAESLRKGLELLKAELEPRDYHDTDEEESFVDKKTGPVDLSDVFSSSGSKIEARKESSQESEKIEPPATSFFSSPDQKTKWSSEDADEAKRDNTGVEPPKTVFFSEEMERAAEPPKTPFFSEDAEVTKTYSKLGTGEEQKLRAMYRRAGATTKEEQENIRRQWEAFKELEKQRRDQSGLSGEDDAGLFREPNLKFNVADVVKEDGDIDAEKILQAIGPRPVRKKGASTGSESVDRSADSDSEGNDNAAIESDLDPNEVYDSLYRSIAAAGGGRTKDNPSAKAQEKAEYKTFLQREDQMRQSLDSLDENVAGRADNIDGTIDDISYAEEALASLGSRPTFKRKRRPIVDEGEFSDQGGVLSRGGDLEDDNNDDDYDDDDETEASVPDLAPEWLRKEEREGYRGVSGKFLGSDINDMFDDDQYDKNQRQLAEYERRRAGNKRQMGIDIGDILGRETDDYADYNYDRAESGRWGATSFEARKAYLLEYTELSAIEVNNLMEHRESVYSTGVSQYLSRVNKPFKAFGAIFRLEGVLVDVTGLHQEAWKIVASEYGFRQPMLEDVRRAAVTRPDIAIREIFYWTDDVLLVKDTLESYHKAMKDVFDTWAKEQGLAPTLTSAPQEVDREMAIGSEALDLKNEVVQVADEEEKMTLMATAWSQTAEEFGFRKPQIAEVVQFSILSPEIAVREGFRWSNDSNQINKIVSSYNRAINELTGGSVRLESLSDTSNSGASRSRSADEISMLELQYQVWTKLAKEIGKDAPTSEEVLAASVLNDPVEVIRNGYGWTDDFKKAKDLARRFELSLAELVNVVIHGKSFKVSQIEESASHRDHEFDKDHDSQQSKAESETIGPSFEEVLTAHVEAWRVVSEAHGFKPPSADEIQLTMNMKPEEAVRRVVAWSFQCNEDQIKAIANTFEDALRKASKNVFTKYGFTDAAPPTQSTVEKEESGPSADELFQAMFDAWAAVAKANGFVLPDEDQVVFAMAVGPDEAVLTGFEWTKDPAEATRIVAAYKDRMEAKRAAWTKRGSTTGVAASAKGTVNEDAGPSVTVVPGVYNWVKSLRDVGMEFGVASYLDEAQVDMLLNFAGLSSLIPPEKRVSSTSGYDRDSQQMLGVALRVERRPDHCVVFDCSPYANSAAHEVDMRIVSMVGPYPRYELLSADSSALSFEELTTMNIRRLFGERVYDQPMLDQQVAQPKATPKTKTRFWDDD